ncbi:hypothetical protein LKM21_28305 [Bacillus wiedmannii]|nr:hypothetical protein [Bacillus wiedmannii]
MFVIGFVYFAAAKYTKAGANACSDAIYRGTHALVKLQFVFRLAPALAGVRRSTNVSETTALPSLNLSNGVILYEVQNGRQSKVKRRLANRSVKNFTKKRAGRRIF